LLANTDFISQFYSKISLIKCDSIGNVQWIKKYSSNDSTDSTNSIANDIIQTSNDEYVIVGQDWHYGYIICANKYGDTIGTMLQNFSGYPQFYKVLEQRSNVYWVLGGVSGTDNYLYKVDSLCDLIGANTVNPRLGFVYKVNSNLFFLCNNYSNKAEFIYADTLFNIIQNRTYFMKGYHFKSTNDSGFVFYDYDNSLSKINLNLDSVWSRPASDYIFSGFTSQHGMDVTNTSDGGFALCGNISNAFVQGVFLIKTDPIVIEQWAKNYSFIYSVDNVVSVLQAPDGGYVMFQSGLPDSTNIPRMWIVKARPDGTISLGAYNKVADTFNVSVYPNPTNGEFTITYSSDINSIEVVNLIGEIVYRFNEKKFQLH
jgi:hypothetical protein